MDADTGDIVLVPVPRRFLPEVYRILGDLMTPAPLVTEVDPGADLASDDAELLEVLWNGEDLARLAVRLREQGLRAAISMLDQAADEPGKRIRFTDIVEATQLPNGKARQQLAQLTWMIHGEFRRKNWPVHVRYTSTGRAMYSFDDRHLAAAWHSANSS